MKRIIKIKAIWVICLLSFISALYVNELNLKHTPFSQVRNSTTIATNDDASYLTPAKNLHEKGVWKDNSIGDVSYFLRPPGYGAIYYSLLNLTSDTNALFLLKIIQLCLFSISIYWLFYFSFSIFKSKKIAHLTVITYGILPIASGFLYYTLTEGVTPALLLYYIYLLFKAEEINIVSKKRIYYLLASLVFSFLLLMRPVLGFFIILLPLFILKDYIRKGAKTTLLKMLIYTAIAFSFIIIWQIRNYNITNKIVGLHPIYQPSNNSIYRPAFKEYWNFSSGFAQEGSTVHSYMGSMWEAAIKGDTSIAHINNAITTFPTKVTNYFGKERLTSAFRMYQKATLEQKIYYDNKLPMPSNYSPTELEAVAAFKSLSKEFKSKFWIDYYFVSPAKVFAVMAFHSNLNLHIFQHTYRGKPIIEVLRHLTYAIHSLCFIMLLISLIVMKNFDWRLSIISLICFGYVFYLCFFQRGIEERYTLPILPLLIIIAIECGKQLFNKLR